MYDTHAYLIAPGGEETCVLMSGGNLSYTTSDHRFQKRAWPNDLLNIDPLLAHPPNFVGPDGKPFTEDDGYRLSPGSPCRDTGEEVSNYSVSTDIFGISRKKGRKPDIGCHEL